MSSELKWTVLVRLLASFLAAALMALATPVSALGLLGGWSSLNRCSSPWSPQRDRVASILAPRGCGVFFSGGTAPIDLALQRKRRIGGVAL